MQCPIPRFIRHKLVNECKPMQVGANDEALKSASFSFIERHYKYCASCEVFSIEHLNVERAGENIGSYKITVERID